MDIAWQPVLILFGACVVAYFIMEIVLPSIGDGLGRVIVNFWRGAGILGSGEGKPDNPRVNGLILVFSILFVLLAAFFIIAFTGTDYGIFKLLALMFVVAMFAPLIAKRLVKRKRK